MINNAVLIEQTKNIRIKGKIESRQVARIPLDQLFYNDQNDRIASQICKYMDEKKCESFSVNDYEQEKYNDIVAEFIKNSNIEAFKKTKSNIEKFTQIEAGVVLASGRIIDGNRRYTCLRELYKETGKSEFGYFNAVILDDNVTEKEIKTLELEIQHGQEEKVDYDVIDRCAGIYKDLIKENHLFTVKEYVEATDSTEQKVKALMDKTNLIIEFLDFIEAPEKFHIARDLEIDGPISELLQIKNKYTEEDWNKAKIVTFTAILTKTEKDITRYVREIKNFIINDKDRLNKAFDNIKETSEKMTEIVAETENVTSDDIKEKIRGNDELKQGVKDACDSLIDQGKAAQAKNEPIKLLDKGYSALKEVDGEMIEKMNFDEKNKVNTYLQDLENIINELKEKAKC